jgi:hypothetical protein
MATLRMRHQESATVTMTGVIGALAKHTVVEDDGAPRVVRWQPATGSSVQQNSPFLPLSMIADGQVRVAGTAGASALDRPSCKVFLAEGLDEILTAKRLRLPPELRRSLACTNAIENMQGTIRGGAQHEALAPRLDGTAVAAAGIMAAQAGSLRLKAHRQLPALGGALADQRACKRPHVTSNLPNDDFLLRATS